MSFQSFNEMYGRFLDTSGIRHKITDIAYGDHERQKLDIYYPEEESTGSYPVVVFIHGGAFIKGDKGRYQLLGALQGIHHGHAVISLNYRYETIGEFPSYVCDVHAAMRYIAHHAEELHINKEKITVWGESAGAYLAMVEGITYQTDTFMDKTINPYQDTYHICSIVDWYGCDIGVLSMPGMEKPQELIDQSKLYQYFHTEMPVMLIQHGTEDEFVPLAVSQTIQQEYNRICGYEKAVLEEFPGFHHGVAEYSEAENIEHIFRFINEHE